VRSEVTELTPEEQDYARSRLAQLAEQFTVDGTLRSPRWEQAFRRTWRHPYVPRYYLDHGAGPLISAAEEQYRSQWLAGVYSDQTLVTKMVPMPNRKAGCYTSSSTMPSLMLTMLQALDLTDGARVLEIGTGSGYQAALLCERLGSAQMLSIDIDPELVELARTRLAASGYNPTLAAADGAGGYPEYAPYDRIVATCAVPAIPLAWLEQVVPGGIIMADGHGPLDGTVVR
jgi:protein-L-isoaspartate O-methyltransferase